MVLVMMLPPQHRALTLRLCQLWCVTTAWVAGCSREGEPGVWGESDASLTLSDQLHQLGSQNQKRRDCMPYILIHYVEGGGRRRERSLISFKQKIIFAQMMCLELRFRTCLHFHHLFTHFSYLLSPNEHEADCSRGSTRFTTPQSELHPRSQLFMCLKPPSPAPVLVHIGSFNTFRVNPAHLSDVYCSNTSFCLGCMTTATFLCVQSNLMLRNINGRCRHGGLWVRLNLWCHFRCKSQPLTAFNRFLVFGWITNPYYWLFFVFCVDVSALFSWTDEMGWCG